MRMGVEPQDNECIEVVRVIKGRRNLAVFPATVQVAADVGEIAEIVRAVFSSEVPQRAILLA
jgi:hypothetical protein